MNIKIMSTKISDKHRFWHYHHGIQSVDALRTLLPHILCEINRWLTVHTHFCWGKRKSSFPWPLHRRIEHSHHFGQAPSLQNLLVSEVMLINFCMVPIGTWFLIIMRILWKFDQWKSDFKMIQNKIFVAYYHHATN